MSFLANSKDEYKEKLQNRLISQLKRWFPNGDPFVFTQDGTPCQTARSVKAQLTTTTTYIYI